MPSTFDNRFRKAAFPRHASHFGEPVTYFFRAGGQRDFNAIIERSPEAFYNAGGEVVLPDFTVRFPNSCECGILASEIDQGDTILMLLELGDTTPKRVTVMKLISQDSGVCVVACTGDE